MTEGYRIAMWLCLILPLTSLLISTVSFAHGTDHHVLGTVTAIQGTHIEVKTPMGGTVDVRVNRQTQFKEKHNPKAAHMLLVGDRVIITTIKNNERLLATEVHFSSARRVPVPIQPVSVR
jgi:hypothetical protein